MIIFIDKGTTRSNYPKLCLSDNAVSFSTLMSTAGLVMQGKKFQCGYRARCTGYHISYREGKVSVKERWIFKMFITEMIIGSTWLDLLSTSDPPRSSLSETLFFCPFWRPFEARKLYQNTHIFGMCVYVCVCLYSI